MADPTGGLTLKAGGNEYRLHLGISVLAEVQEKHGAAFDAFINGEGNGLPNLQIVHDLFMGALQRYHGDEADRYLVDALVAENLNALGLLMEATMPSAEGKAQPKAKARRG